MKLSVLLMEWGQTATFKDNEQATEIQEPWILVFAEYLKNKGVDPTFVEYTLPNGQRAEVFETQEGYNWKIL